MRVFGFRSDPVCPRYAVVEHNQTGFSLLNQSSECRLKFPADCSTDVGKITWLYRELERVFATHTGIVRAVIKTGEFTRIDSAAKRLALHQEAALLLYCGLHQLPVDAKLYASLSTTNTDVKHHATTRVGQTNRYWDSKMADAVIAGWWGALNP